MLPDKIAQYAEIRAASVVQISGGEHEYTRYGIKALLDERTPIYESVATISVDTDGRSPQDVAAEIIDRVEASA